MFNDFRARCAFKQLLTSSPASFFTTCWADSTLVAAMAEAKLCRQKKKADIRTYYFTDSGTSSSKVLKVL